MSRVAPGSPLDASVAAYLKWEEPTSMAAARVLLERARLRPGSDVLDVAAGTGALAWPAARAGHRVRGIDLATGMLAVLRDRLAPYPGSEAEEMSALDLRYGDGSFDAAFSVLGVFFLGTGGGGGGGASAGGGGDGTGGGGVEAALAEMARVTRPGGIIGAVHYATGLGPERFQLLDRALERLDDPGCGRLGTGHWGYTQPAELERALRGAGCTGVATEWLVLDDPLPPPDDMLSELHLSYLRHPDYPKSLDQGRRERLRAALALEARRSAAPGGDRPRTIVNLVTGRIPGP